MIKGIAKTSNVAIEELANIGSQLQVQYLSRPAACTTAL